MKFLKSLFHFDDGASLFEKIMTIVVPCFAAFLIIWLILASYGVGNSALAKAHEAAHGGSASLWATVLFIGAAVWAWLNWTDRIAFRVNDIVATIILLVLIILAVNANTGFFAYVR